MRQWWETIRWTLAGLVAPDLLEYVQQLQAELLEVKRRDYR